MIKIDPNHPAATKIKEIENWYMDGLVTKDEAIEMIIALIRRHWQAGSN